MLGTTTGAAIAGVSVGIAGAGGRVGAGVAVSPAGGCVAEAGVSAGAGEGAWQLTLRNPPQATGL
jgi:hypothetical protein